MPAADSPPAMPQSKDLAVPTPTMALNQKENMANTKRKIICFSDFDGTIFMQDTGHILFDAHGCGPTHRNILDEQIKTGERSFREVSEEMWGSLNVPFDDGFTVMKDTLEIDPDFRSFHEYCIAHSIPFNVISAGLKPILKRVLEEFLGEEQASHIDIVANEAEISKNGESWKPIWRHDTELGHDKALSITEARNQANLEADDGTIPLIVFIGDGVSDLPAAREADVLFARRGLRLEEYCVENQIPYLGFDTFADIQKEIDAIRVEDEKVTEGKGVPKRFNPRANLWRRVSSQRAVPRLVVATPSREEKMFLWPEAFSEFKPKAGIAEEVAA
ncbi:probable 2,3-diketo-5-methylthio-1-phosphopentane phosphatase, putative [Rhynchosporium agropyri]|uniref:Probable 2,3-diketo-5-methylthio-1-phosphopentane phosphatase, putative n=1 Tax=Rhynchosporium agropyri TaxID=914238 RepID=A0A1E1LKX3_9HELO|nr:probable 2,3-diketo-5-methylthio-1-phosphopentane phosphatase, putative [Rhynchosporium agropyri]